MPLFAVIRRRTERWAFGRPIEAQAEWRAHADYMDALEAEGFFLLAGPLEQDDEVLLIVRAESTEEVGHRLATNDIGGGRRRRAPTGRRAGPR